jgi:hypothetical protein
VLGPANANMKPLHRFLNSGWFRFVAAFGFGWIIHDSRPNPSEKDGSHRRDHPVTQTPRWGLVLYGVGILCGVAGIVLNFSGSLQTGTWLIGVAIAVTGSTALQLGHLKLW